MSMKKLLRWLFRNEFENFMSEVQNNMLYRDIEYTKILQKGRVAESFLKSLGYKITYESGVREQPSSVMYAREIGYKLEKIT